MENIDTEQRLFLENQRIDGRIGYINDIESWYDKLEQEELRREQMMAERLARSEKEKSALGKLILVE